MVRESELMEDQRRSTWEAGEVTAQLNCRWNSWIGGEKGQVNGESNVQVGTGALRSVHTHCAESERLYSSIPNGAVRVAAVLSSHHQFQAGRKDAERC